MSLLPAIPNHNKPVSADTVLSIERRIADSIQQIDDIDILEEWRAQAAALEAYLRSRDLQRPILGAQRRVEARIGQLLGEPAKGGRGKLSDMPEGLATDHATDFRLLARALTDDCPLTDDEWRKSRRALVMLVRNKLGLMPETKPLPDGMFHCIVADPPWTLDTGPDVFGGTGESGHDDLEYPQMSVPEIAALDVQKIAAPDSHLYLWTTNRYVEAAYGVARAWGFKPSVLLVWAKPIRGVGLGDAFRLTTEFVLYARRGSLKEARIVERTWFDWPRSKHSVKPVAFFDLVESVSPSPRLEMFARRKRQGWTVWGNEVE